MAFTIVLAGFAATFTLLPNISLTPAFVAGFVFVLIMHSPGIVNLPFFASAVPISARASRTFAHSDFLWPVAVASARAIPPFGKAFTLLAFMTFMAFIAFIAFMTGLAQASCCNYVVTAFSCSSKG